MKITINNSEELIGRHNASPDMIWVAAPLPLLLLGAIFSDPLIAPIQVLFLMSFSLVLLVIITTKIEWTTLHLMRSDQSAKVRRWRLVGPIKHDLPLSDVIKARPDVYYHETGSKSYRLVLELRGVHETEIPAVIPLVGVAKDWDALAVADKINAWLEDSRSLQERPKNGTVLRN